MLLLQTGYNLQTCRGCNVPLPTAAVTRGGGDGRHQPRSHTHKGCWAAYQHMYVQHNLQTDLQKVHMPDPSTPGGVSKQMLHSIRPWDISMVTVMNWDRSHSIQSTIHHKNWLQTTGRHPPTPINLPKNIFNEKPLIFQTAVHFWRRGHEKRVASDWRWVDHGPQKTDSNIVIEMNTNRFDIREIESPFEIE